MDVADASGQTQAAGEDKKKERSEVCKVCGGTGQVRTRREAVFFCFAALLSDHVSGMQQRPGSCCSVAMLAAVVGSAWVAAGLCSPAAERMNRLCCPSLLLLTRALLSFDP